jgi:hypothetical protein
MEQQFIRLCKKGNLKGAKEFLQLHPDVNISHNNDYAFQCVICYAVNLEFAKWLLSVKPDINISVLNDWAFCWSCSHGQLDIAQWLLLVKPDINISALEKAFCGACANGHLEIAQWLLILKPDINMEEAFISICHEEYLERQERHLEIAKWMLLVKPDINISEEAFCLACAYGNLKLAQWIQSVKPYLYAIIYDKHGKCTGFKIREKEEVMWEKRKYALHMMTHKEEPNLLYYLPIDIAKTVVLFVN